MFNLISGVADRAKSRFKKYHMRIIFSLRFLLLVDSLAVLAVFYPQDGVFTALYIEEIACGVLSQTQKNPQNFRCAGFQDFVSGSGDHQQRILVELAGVEPASEIPTSSALHA